MKPDADPHHPAPDSRHDPQFRDSSPRWLADLMDPASLTQPAWREGELGVILQHQMNAPVEMDLSTLGDAAASQTRTLTAGQGLLLRSFADLLHHPHPPVQLLDMVKEFAKANRSHPDSPIPHDVAGVLYYAAIVVAADRCGVRISRLSDAELEEGVAWVLSRHWVDPRTRSLFEHRRRTEA